MATNLVITGGPGHDFESTTGSLVDLLAEAGIASTVFGAPRAALAALRSHPDRWDLVTVNALWWRMDADRYASAREQWAFLPEPGEVEAIEAHVRGGGGLLACHGAVICFDGHPSWHRCTGASWAWDRSSHPPLGRAEVEVTAVGRIHPITQGTDPFSTIDEVYGFLAVEPDVEPLLTSAHGGVDHPLLWARTLDQGRVVTDLLGHDARGMDHPDHRAILHRAARWLTTSDPSEVTP